MASKFNTPLYCQKFILDFAGTSRNLSHVSLLVWILAIALLATACGSPTPLATTEPSPQPPTPLTTTISDQSPAEILLSKYLRFDRLTTEDGLSNDQVRGIVQDNHGFIWIATFDGLNRYDGSSIKVYRHDPDDPNSLSNNVVRLPIVDQKGVLWFGTFGGGLNQYDVEKDAFIRYQHDPDNPNSLSNNTIRAVYEDPAGTIWVGTNEGLNKLNRDSKLFTRYMHDPDDPNSLSNNLVLSVLEDNTGTFWIGTEDGLNRFDPITEQFIHYGHDPDDPTSLSHKMIRSIREDGSGVLWMGTSSGLCELNPERTRFTCYQHDAVDPQTLSNNTATVVYVDPFDEIWVGTWGGGLNLFDRNTERFIRYEHHSTDSYSLSSNNVVYMYGDRQGMLWLSTDGGVSMLDGRAKPFYHYRTMPNDPDSLSNNEVRTLYVDQAGVIWVGTNGGGLSKFDHRTEEFTHYRHDPDEPNSLMGDAVWAIYEDREGLIWVGSYGIGLSRFNPDTEQFVHYQNDPEDPLSLSNNVLTAIFEDRNGNFWIGTENGLNKLDGGTFTRYMHDPNNPHSLSSNFVITIYEDNSGDLWIGTANGLNKYSPEEGTFTHFQHVSTDPQTLGDNTVVSMYESRTGTFWIGTLGGLDKFDRKNEQFSHYTMKHGLSSDAVYGILEDEQGLLWLSTTNGLSRFDPRTESSRNYDVSDGLQGDSFLYYSAFARSQNGKMYFGGSNGFNAFYPDQIVDNLAPPPVVITDFQLKNKPVPIGGDSVLQKSIIETDDLVLSYLDDVFSFEFAALNFQVPEKNRYKYKMEGFNEDWNDVDSTRRFATYTNLDPGDYVFRVIASNNDGVWNEEGASVKITITPPWWETTWFRIGLGLLIAGLLATGYVWRVRSVEKRRRELEALVIERTAALDSAEEQIRKLFESTQAGIALSTYEGDLLAVNPALLGMTGYTEEEALDLNVATLYSDPSERVEMLQQLEQEHAVRDFGVKVKRKDGTDLFVSLNVSTTKRGDKDVLLVLIEDETERINAGRRRELSAAQAERDRLARDLHDSVTQGIYSASLIAETLPVIYEEDQEQGQRGLLQLERLTQGALAEMRTLLLEMQPEALLNQELPYLVRLLAKTMMARGNISISTTIMGDFEAPTEVKIALYRIAQEALNNVVKHSQASNAKIYLEYDDEQIILRVSDDGIGFDSENPKSHGIGIGIMTKRASEIDASLSITSHSNEGTSILVRWHRSAQE